MDLYSADELFLGEIGYLKKIQIKYVLLKPD